MNLNAIQFLFFKKIVSLNLESKNSSKLLPQLYEHFLILVAYAMFLVHLVLIFALSSQIVLLIVYIKLNYMMSDIVTINQLLLIFSHVIIACALINSSFSLAPSRISFQKQQL